MTEIKTEDERVEIIMRAAICGTHHDEDCSSCQWARKFNDRELDELRAAHRVALSLQDELVEALEPFARAWVDDDGSGLFDDETRVGDRAAGQSITFGDLRRARSLLTRIKSERDGI